MARIKYSKKKPALRDIMLANTDFVGTMASAFAPIVNTTCLLYTSQLERITLPNKDVDFLREKLLLMYANPLTNYLAATK